MKLREKYVPVLTLREKSKQAAEARELVDFKGRKFGIGITTVLNQFMVKGQISTG